MIKVITVIALLILLIIILFFTFIWWQSLKQPPAFGLIVEKYYVCKEHRILEGGIFGKGPTRKFSKTNGKSWCSRNEWEEIDRKTFKKLATEWYGVDWSDEIPYWQRD